MASLYRTPLSKIMVMMCPNLQYVHLGHLGPNLNALHDPSGREVLHLDCIKVLCITPFCRLSRYRAKSQEDNS